MLFIFGIHNKNLYIGKKEYFMVEIWKTIEDYPNYMISSMGRVKSLGNNKTRKEKIRKLQNSKDGYLQIELWKNGNGKKYQVHRLVAEAFIDNPNNNPEIDHINTNKTDNRVCNLRWVTPKENMSNPLTKNKMRKNSHLKNKFGIEHPKSKPIIQFTLDGKLVRKWESAKEVKRDLGFDNSSITKCCIGKCKLAYGFIWKYAI